jgi:NADPH2:quinone reductase
MLGIGVRQQPGDHSGLQAQCRGPRDAASRGHPGSDPTPPALRGDADAPAIDAYDLVRGRRHNGIVSMKAIGLSEFGGPEVLRVVDLPDPEPGPGEVRIRVHAAGVNPTDITFRSGGRAPQLAEYVGPYVPGVDAAGVVDKLGPDSDGRLMAGERVSAFVVPMGLRGGSYAECVVVPEASVVPAPRGASIWEAATLLLNATAARLSLDALALSAGEAVAIVGGAGAVGGYAMQLAKAEDGLTVLTNASGPDDELVRSLGADLIVGTTGDIAREMRREMPDGVPGAIDGAGLNEAILPAIADGGGLVTLKGWGGPSERRISIHPISSFDAATNTALFDHLRQLAGDGTLTLRVAEVIPATEASEAHRRLAAGGLRGRLVLDFSEPL